MPIRTGYVSEIFASFQGEGKWVGRRHLFVRMAGCNIRCRYCDTPDSLNPIQKCLVYLGGEEVREVANPLTPAALSNLLGPLWQKEKGLHALALTGGEPLSQTEFLREWLAQAQLSLPVLLETNGTYPEKLKHLLPWIRIVSMDIKLPSNSGERAFWRDHEEFLRASAEKDVYVKLPVDEETLLAEVETGVRLIAGVDRYIPLYLQPLVSYPEGVFLISPERLNAFYALACRYLCEVRILPQIHKVLGIR
jgi:7-carboxy-7-deazaguanine synthase